MNLTLSWDSIQVLLAFFCYLLGVAFLGVFAHRYLTRGSFVKEYFLGNRGLGPWVLALTVAATAISGGTFMGFPSLIYTNGWIMALWICSYMVTPLMAMALLGKRINQVSRISGSVTIPDVLRDRFESPILGIIGSSLILLFLVFNLVAQFKAGGLVMKEAIRLPPAEATLLTEKTTVDNDRQVSLTFQVAGLGETQVKTPLPSEHARFLRTDVDTTEKKVHVVFELNGEEKRKTLAFPPQRIVFNLPWPMNQPVELGYLIGLLVFAITVISYTTYGGFWAVTWTDVLEGLVMFVGIVIMACLAMYAVPRSESGLTGLAAATEHLSQMKPPDAPQGSLVSGPGPGGFLGVGLAFSFFVMWSFGSAGQPSAMVRLMSFKDTTSLRRAIMLVAVYYLIVYVCIIVIFICARAIFPTQYLREVGSEGQPDSIMPAMARYLAPHPFIAGLLLAAPYAAIMSTVAAFLLMISSSLIRDLYQRTLNPQASDRVIKALSYTTTGCVGIFVMLAAINPPSFLQYVIVFTGSGQSCAFLAPMVLALFWRRTTRQGVLAGMFGGFLTVVFLYILGWTDSATQGSTAYSALLLKQGFGWIPGWGEKRLEAFAPLYLFGVDTVVWGMLASFLLCVGISLATKPDERLVKKFFP